MATEPSSNGGVPMMFSRTTRPTSREIQYRDAKKDLFLRTISDLQDGLERRVERANSRRTAAVIRDALGQQELQHSMEMKYRRMDIARERLVQEQHVKSVANAQAEAVKKIYLKDILDKRQSQVEALAKKVEAEGRLVETRTSAALKHKQQMMHARQQIEAQKGQRRKQALDDSRKLVLSNTRRFEENAAQRLRHHEAKLVQNAMDTQTRIKAAAIVSTERKAKSIAHRKETQEAFERRMAAKLAADEQKTAARQQELRRMQGEKKDLERHHWKYMTDTKTGLNKYLATGKVTEALLEGCSEDHDLKSTLSSSVNKLHMSWGPLGASLKSDPGELLQHHVDARKRARQRKAKLRVSLGASGGSGAGPNFGLTSLTDSFMSADGHDDAYPFSPGTSQRANSQQSPNSPGARSMPDLTDFHSSRTDGNSLLSPSTSSPQSFSAARSEQNLLGLPSPPSTAPMATGSYNSSAPYMPPKRSSVNQRWASPGYTVNREHVRAPKSLLGM